MKALTIRQPWASLIATGVKTIETRSWRTSYRGDLAIHAGKTPGTWAGIPDAVVERFDGVSLPMGAVVAIGSLVACVPTDTVRFRSRADIGDDWATAGDHGVCSLVDKDQQFYGDFGTGRWAWFLADVTPFRPQVAKGRQGLWEWTS